MNLVTNPIHPHLMERLRTNSGRNPKLDRDLALALRIGRRCTDTGRHDDNYIMPLERNDWITPPRFTWSLDYAIGLVPREHKDAVLREAIERLPMVSGSWWQAMPSRIAHGALAGAMRGEFMLERLYGY